MHRPFIHIPARVLFILCPGCSFWLPVTSRRLTVTRLHLLFYSYKKYPRNGSKPLLFIVMFVWL